MAFLPGKSYRQMSLVGYSLWDHKELDTADHALMHVQFSQGEFSHL